VVASEKQSRVAKSRGDDVEGAPFDIIWNFLLEPRHGDTRLSHDLTAIRRHRAIEELHDRALAGAIASEKADSLAALDSESGAVENGRSTKRDADVLHAQ
jgi:hypothetical protein